MVPGHPPVNPLTVLLAGIPIKAHQLPGAGTAMSHISTSHPAPGLRHGGRRHYELREVRATDQAIRGASSVRIPAAKAAPTATSTAEAIRAGGDVRD
jgi:hypothetical protein